MTDTIRYNNNVEYNYVYYSYTQAKERGRATYFLDYDRKEPIIGTVWSELKDNARLMSMYDDMMYVGRAKHILGPCTDFPKIDTTLFKKVFILEDKLKKVTEFFTDNDLEIK